MSHSGADSDGTREWRTTSDVAGRLEPLPSGEPPLDQFRLLADAIPTPCWIANGDGYIVWYNQRWHDYCGTTASEMEGWGWQSVHDPDVLPQVMDRWTRALADGEPFEMTFPLKGADGMFRPFLTQVQPVRDSSGEVVRWFGVNTDISAQVAAEDALRASEERLRIVQTAGGIGSFDYDLDSDIAHVSDEYRDLLGLPHSTTVNLEVGVSVIHPDDKEATLHAFEQAVAERTDFHHVFRVIRPDNGAIRWISNHASLFVDDDGKPSRYVGGIRDVTDQKTAEEALRQNEERLRVATGSAAIGTWDFDPVTGDLQWDDRCKQLFGIADDTPIDYDLFLAGLHPEDREATDRAVKHALEPGGSGRYDVEYRTIGIHDGVLRWVSATGGAYFRDSGSGSTASRFVGTIVDITEQKQTLAALRESQTRMLAILDSAPGGFYCVDPDGTTNLVSRGFLDMMGFESEADAIGKKLHAIIHHTRPDGSPYPVHDCPIYRCASTGETAHVPEELFFRPDGSAVPVEYWVSPIHLGDERIGAICTITDLTDRKAAQDALRETEERYRLAARATNDAIWDWDLVDNHVRWNEALEANFGHRLDSIAPTGDWWLDQIHPDDRERISESIHAVIDGDGLHWEGEYRFRTANGDYRSVLDRGFVIRDASNRAVRMIGAMFDQTERLRSQQELAEASRRLQTLNRTGSALAAELDLEKIVSMVTDAGVELTGAKFGAFFYNVINAAGEQFLLYSLSGAKREDFEKFGMPRATAVFKPTFVGEGVIRSDDITSDPRYGKNKPHKGMPKGHLPVRSYLAVPVVSRSGEVIGGLFFGHPQTGQFTERHEQLMVGIAAQAAVAIDNARLYQSAQTELNERMRAETELRELNETLEQRVGEEIKRRSVAEEALRQSQKMETLGQLTGGIAHDFNNLLQVVAGNLDILKRRLPADEPKLMRAAENAMTGAMRAATLTQRLLAFSRRQPLEPKAIDINKLLAAMSELLHRTLGETIEVESVLAPRLWPVEADPNQLENAIINLAVNARDAMNGGGKLTIETANTYLDRDYAAVHPEIQPGQYSVICISDTGEGMDSETVKKAVEPFFTTKEVGKGTGLGLSMVYGFVKQSGGHLRIYSEPGEGTTVKIYLPRLAGEVEIQEDRPEEFTAEGTGTETILVCEDDDDVRAYSVEVLRELGYRVLEAHDGPSALRLLERQEGAVDLLFTDVVLPAGMSGAVLAEKAKALRPRMKTLFTTGYARNAIVHHGRLDPGVELITKPFSYAGLAERIRQILDGV